MGDAHDKRKAPRSAFKAGQSGNPGGRPRVIADIVAIAREHTPEAMAALVGIVVNVKAPPAARVRAAEVLLDRGYGRAPTTVTINQRGVHDLTDADLIAIISGEGGAGAAEPPEGEPEPDLVH